MVCQELRLGQFADWSSQRRATITEESPSPGVAIGLELFHDDAFMHSLAQRDRRSEWMDHPDLDVKLHHQALVGLRRINWFSGIAPHFWRILKALASNSGSQPLRVLDVASGGGDIPIRLALRAARAGVKLQFSGCDVSPTAVAAAQQAATRAGAQSLEFFQHDALRSELPSQYHVVMCSLFLHHLSGSEAEMLLRRMAAAARHAVLVDDLLRTQVGYFLAWAGCRLLTRSPVVHMDGPLSVRAAFSWEEAQVLAVRAGLSSAVFSRHWPQRYFMHWSRS